MPSQPLWLCQSDVLEKKKQKTTTLDHVWIVQYLQIQNLYFWHLSPNQFIYVL